jgi:putative ubiquitin-RnfH superfamily antitoxin RatB of RatAB toxin-antitoxin module
VNHNAITVTIAYSPAARQVHEVSLTLPVGSTVRAAIDASGLLAQYPEIQLASGAVGIWGNKKGPNYLLRDGDRVEIWRPLRVDPKLARRERFGKQGARAAGLFAQRRPGAKPGY